MGYGGGLLPRLPRKGAVKRPQICLVRRGTKTHAAWQLVVRYPWGKRATGVKYIEDLGFYQAYTDERGKRYIRVKTERIKYWIGAGVQISSGAYRILNIAGIVPPLCAFIHLWNDICDN